MMTDADSTATRLTELEIKITYQDDLIKTLDQVIFELRGEIASLHARVNQLEERQARQQNGVAADEKPPHY